ncbi:MAG: sensor histidine kinase [Fimbriimonadales bacterium]|nr:sensor histidine kinase [Fimbriimonadales bacterium]
MVPQPYRRFSRVNLPVWMIVGATVVWAVLQKRAGAFTLEWGRLTILIVLALLSVAARTWVGLKDPRVMYRLSLPLVAFDLALITVAVRFTGGYESHVWLLYFALLASEAAVMSPRGLILMLGLTTIGYGWACAPIPPDDWYNFGYRVVSVSLVSWLAHQIYRSHVEYRIELADLREQYELAQERERIAREFHDGLGHHLVSAIRGLESLQRRLHPLEDKALSASLQEQINTLRDALQETRQTIQQLRSPETVDLRSFVKQTAQRVAQHLNAELHCNCPDALPPLTPLQTLMLTRVMQEALSNIMKHAGSPQHLWVECAQHDRWLTIRIADDGDGFDPDAALQGVGLMSMRDRIHALGGELYIQSAIGQGTTITARIPLQE